VPPTLLELLGPGQLDTQGEGGGGPLGPPERTQVGVGMKPLATLYLGGTNKLIPPDGFWVGLAIEVFKELYLGGSDGFDLRGSGVPMGS
jgi:hypothetical protein